MFDSLLKLLRLKKIRHKYFFFMIVLSIPAMFVLGFISHQIAKENLINNQRAAIHDHLATSSRTFDLLLRDVVNLERLISWNSDIQRELISSTNEYDDKKIGNDTAQRMKNILANYLINPQYVDSVCLFDKQFRSVCYGNARSVGTYDKNESYTGIEYTDWYSKTLEANGKEVILGQNILTDSQSSNTFSLIKLIKDSSDLFNPQEIGLLVINVKKTMFEKMFKEDAKDNFIVLYSKDQVVDVVNNANINPSVYKSVHTDYESSIERLEREGYLVSSYKNGNTGWLFVHAIEKEELLKQSTNIAVVTAVIASILALISLLLSFFISGSITKPVRDLKNKFAHISDSKDEIRVLTDTFNYVTEENKLLNHELMSAKLKEKEAELRALQAQVKPHFLYNTLDSIYWMAVMEKNDNIAKMTIALSESFKLSLNNGEDLILLSKELEHIRHYLTIQNMRFNDRFEYVEDIEESLYNEKILKLLLQPLVENAIYHGLEPKNGTGYIRITGRRHAKYIYFCVEDDGVGVDDLGRFEKGYGVKNVRERIRLFYGPNSSFHITSKVNVGTKIEMILVISKE